MPHAELKYSSDLDLDAARILARIEQIIGDHDAGAGACKGRAYPTDLYHHSHLLVEVSVLPKPHRDQAFMDALLRDLEQGIKACLTQDCAFSLALSFSGTHYVTNAFKAQ